MKKNVIAILLAACMLLALTACAAKAPAADTASDNTAADTAPAETPADATENTEDPSADDGKVYTVGICQLVQHEALDAATQGFKDALTEALGDKVVFEEQNASNDIPTCGTICAGFAASNVDLILANATPALQAAVSATQTIPILGTAVTEYGVALDIDDFSGTVGGNVSGTSDLAPLDEQAALIKQLFPDVKKVGLLYCTAEPNSKYQIDVVTKALTDMGIECAPFGFSDSNDIASVTTNACSECDVIYVPTDNTAANNTEVINNICLPAKVPVVAGEEGICAGCGVATLSISYYDIGAAAGQMAYDILVNGADISTMPIQYAPQVTKKYNAANCEELGVTVPEDFVAIE